MEEITLATGNLGKWKIAKDIFDKYNINLLHEKINTPEIQSNDVVEVSKYSALYAAKKLNKQVIKSDVGYYIEELGITNIKNISNIKQIIQWPKENNFIITEYVFIVEINKNQKITLSKEHTNYKWCNFKEAYQILEKENNKNTLKLINRELIN